MDCPHGLLEISQDWKDIPASCGKVMCQLTILDKPLHSLLPERAVNHLGASRQAITQTYCNLTMLSTQQLPSLSSFLKKDNAKVNRARHPSKSLLLREREKLDLSKIVLYRVTTPLDQ